MDIYYGSTYVGSWVNTNTGVPAMDHDLAPVTSQLMCPPDQALSIVVTDAASTNAVYLVLDILEVDKK